MICIWLMGGLGNQLFQYAAARALALRCGVQVVLDRRHYNRDRRRTIRLDRFRIKVAKADPPGKGPAAWLGWRLFGHGPTRLIEKGPAHDPRFERLTAPAWLHGYWQSERYFLDCAAQIRAELQLKAPPAPEAKAMLSRIAAGPSLSLHIRRGDYVGRRPLGTCAPDYYRRAAELIAAQTGQVPTIYAFSDDPDWVRAELSLPFDTVVVDLNGPDRPEEDLRLMSACAHHIIANSTFSWWGAWLNPSPAKIVIAPRKWFRQPSMANPDILPPGWQAIDGGV